MYLTDSDYSTLINDYDLDVVQQSEELTRQKAEAAAIEYFKGYLRSRYDVAELFARAEDERDPVLIQFLIDEVLYTLHSTLPGNMMPEIRRERKDAVDKWLLDVRKGLTQPDFPTIDDDETTDLGNPVRFGGSKKLESAW